MAKKFISELYHNLPLILVVIVFCIVSYNMGRADSLDATLSTLRSAKDAISQQEIEIQKAEQYLERANMDNKNLLAAIRFWRDHQAYVEHVSIYYGRAIFYLSDRTWWDCCDGIYLKSGDWSSFDDFLEDTELPEESSEDNSAKDSSPNPFIVMPKSEEALSA